MTLFENFRTIRRLSLVKVVLVFYIGNKIMSFFKKIERIDVGVEGVYRIV